MNPISKNILIGGGDRGGMADMVSTDIERRTRQRLGWRARRLVAGTMLGAIGDEGATATGAVIGIGMVLFGGWAILEEATHRRAA